MESVGSPGGLPNEEPTAGERPPLEAGLRWLARATDVAMFGSLVVLISSLFLAMALGEAHSFLQRSLEGRSVAPSRPTADLWLIALAGSWLWLAIGAVAGAVGLGAVALIVRESRAGGRARAMAANAALLWVGAAALLHALIVVATFAWVPTPHTMSGAASAPATLQVVTGLYEGLLALALLNLLAVGSACVAMLTLLRPKAADGRLPRARFFVLWSLLGPLLVLMAVLSIPSALSGIDVNPADPATLAALLAAFIEALGTFAWISALASLFSIFALRAYKRMIGALSRPGRGSRRAPSLDARWGNDSPRQPPAAGQVPPPDSSAMGSVSAGAPPPDSSAMGSVSAGGAAARWLLRPRPDFRLCRSPPGARTRKMIW